MSEKKETQLLNSIYFKIKKISEQMKISMEKKDLRQVLKYSEEIISQLKIEFTSTQLYYQLFTFIFDEILQIQSYFRKEINSGRNILDFYKSVQQCITVLPRVYLMIIVGTLIIENKKADTNEIIEDLIVACNAVQHPIRGLFVRYFLLKILKDYINNLDLLMDNFREMNKLWIRVNKIEYLTKFGIKKVRNDLKVLLGENIMRFAFVLNNTEIKDTKINKESIYKDKILIPILNIIKNGGDEISQEYILICLIQVFNEECNLKSIEIIIDTLKEINNEVDLKNILIDFFEKLLKFKEIEKVKNIKINNIIKKINETIENIINNYFDNIKKTQIKEDENENINNENINNENKDIENKDIEKKGVENKEVENKEVENKEIENKGVESKGVEKDSNIKKSEKNNVKNVIDINDKELISIIELISCFIKFIIHFDLEENKIEIINIINKSLDKCYELLNLFKSQNIDNPNSLNKEQNNLKPENMKILYNLLLSLAKSHLSIFELKNFSNLAKYLSTIFKYELSINILNSLVNNFNLGKINNKNKLENVFKFIEPMIQIDQAELNEYLLDKSIYKISKLVYIPSSKDPYEQLEMLKMTKNFLINTTKNNTEYLKEKKNLLYLTNYINSLYIFGINLSESYDNIVNKENDKSKKSQIHIDFCNNFNFHKTKINIKDEDTFFPLYQLLFNEINSVFDIIKPLSVETSLKLYIQCSQMVNGVKFEDIDKYEIYAYNFINNAILLLKNDNKKEKDDINVIDENKKFEYLTSIIGAVSKMDIFDEKHFSSICDDLEKISEGLVKRNEQCLSMLKCINLYCNEVEEDINKIVELFSKAKKYAVYSMTNPENTILFIKILNEYLRLDGIIKDLDKSIKINDVEEIIETIKNYLITLKTENKDQNLIKKIEDYYNNTIDTIIKRKGEKNGKLYKLISSLKINK